jgi:hypothetical protein
LFEVTADLGEVEGMEGDLGVFGERVLLMAAEVEQADTGDDMMGSALEERQHAAGVIERGRFAEEQLIEADEGIGAEDEMVGVLFGDVAGFAIGIELAEFVGAEVIMMHFGKGAGDDLEIEAEVVQEFAAAGGGGCEDQGWRLHGFGGGF